MAANHEPVPGFYYINLTGQLIKVKALLYVYGELTRVVVEYLDGGVTNLPAQEWDWLELTRYNDWLGRRNRSVDLEYES